METKFCPDCRTSKPSRDFPKNKSTKSGLHSYCKSCSAQRCRTYQQNNPDAYKRAKRKHHLKSLYGISPEEFDSLLGEQNGRCAICRTTEPGHKGVFAVDHCHWTNKVRGLLCCNCNRGLGYFKDNAMTLEQALEYLKAA